jgi:hypothetical protein
MILLRLGDHFGGGILLGNGFGGGFFVENLGVVADDTFVVLLGFLRVVLGESGF